MRVKEPSCGQMTLGANAGKRETSHQHLCARANRRKKIIQESSPALHIPCVNTCRLHARVASEGPTRDLENPTETPDLLQFVIKKKPVSGLEIGAF